MQYAIKLVLDGDLLLKTCNLNNPYNDIKDFLFSKGFECHRGDFYFANSEMTSVNCICTIMDLAKVFPWINACTKECQLLHIDSKTDLIPAINHVR